ncbi:MAG: hypothetical protein HKN45_06005 [Flavobacteriales bacterium]|nr:hypothetical protein [Flavobacteriales bacterium]
MKYTLSILTVFIGLTLYSQKLDVKETWVSGYARSVLYNDDYTNESETDTTTAAKLMSGHTLVDLAVNVKPNDKVFIQGMVRIRNDHGGFWGSGTTFDVRNLYLRGLIGKGFRYSVGDINYKLTPYTMFNTEEEMSHHDIDAFRLMRDLTRFDLFYNDDNSWRQQGATGEFGLTFKKGIEELDFTGFTSRLNWTANNGLLERLHSGANIQLKQSKYLDLHLTYVDAFDIPGTSASTTEYNNPVLTGGIGLHYRVDDWNLDLASELGNSTETLIIGDDESTREDYFADIDITVTQREKNLKVGLGYQEVGPDFRSIGAQTKRVDFNSANLAFQRYGNMQDLRPIGMLDLIRDASLYNTELSPGLMPYNPSYGNAQPYGAATPNRRNMSLSVDWQDSEEMVNISAQGIMGEEVIGEGTSALRSFNTYDILAVAHLDRLIGLDRNLTLTIGYWGESTNRDGTESYEEVALDNSTLTAGLNFEFVEDFEFIAGYRKLVSQGNEFSTRANIVGDIITFTPMDIDFEEDLFAVGARYNFSENSIINFQWTGYNFVDAQKMQQDYSLSNVSLIYRMIF